MATYSVPVVITVSGELTVEADSLEEAITKARAKYNGTATLDSPCWDVDFANGDDPAEVELVKEEQFHSECGFFPEE